MGKWIKPLEDILTGYEAELWDRYPRHVVQAFFAVNYDNSMPILNGPPYPWPRDEDEVVAEAIEAFVQRWGGLSNEIFVQVLKQAQGRDRLVAMFTIGFSPLPQAANLLAPFLVSTDLLERCAAAIMLGSRRDERALPILEEYLLAEVPIIEVKVPTSQVLIRQIKPEAVFWFNRYRPWVAGVLATWGPASVNAVLRTAFFKYWEQEQQKQRPDYHLSDGLLYALGRRGALAALHGMTLSDLHRHQAMIYLALGALQADENFDDLHEEMMVNKGLKQEIVSVCTEHFGISEQEAVQCVTRYSYDYLARWKNLGTIITNFEGFIQGDPNSAINADES
jgi:hypothetical protein